MTSYIPRAPCARILLHQRAADKIRRGETADSFQLRLRHQTALRDKSLFRKTI